jgi:hypothetical protein
VFALSAKAPGGADSDRVGKKDKKYSASDARVHPCGVNAVSR